MTGVFLLQILRSTTFMLIIFLEISISGAIWGAQRGAMAPPKGILAPPQGFKRKKFELLFSVFLQLSVSESVSHHLQYKQECHLLSVTKFN